MAEATPLIEPATAAGDEDESDIGKIFEDLRPVVPAPAMMFSSA